MNQYMEYIIQLMIHDYLYFIMTKRPMSRNALQMRTIIIFMST